MVRRPRKRADEQIRSDLEEALTEDAWLDASEIQVRAENGVVSLTGTVEDRQAKRRAEDMADKVAGVCATCEMGRIAGLWDASNAGGGKRLPPRRL